MSASATAARSTTSALASTCRILLHCPPHPPDRINLVLERLPVVAFRDRRPDALDLVDMHRAGLRVGPIWMRLPPFAALERPGERAEGVGRIKLLTGLGGAAAVDEDAGRRR